MSTRTVLENAEWKKLLYDNARARCELIDAERAAKFTDIKTAISHGDVKSMVYLRTSMRILNACMKVAQQIESSARDDMVRTQEESTALELAYYMADAEDQKKSDLAHAANAEWSRVAHMRDEYILAPVRAKNEAAAADATEAMQALMRATNARSQLVASQDAVDEAMAEYKYAEGCCAAIDNIYAQMVNASDLQAINVVEKAAALWQSRHKQAGDKLTAIEQATDSSAQQRNQRIDARWLGPRSHTPPSGRIVKEPWERVFTSKTTTRANYRQ
jgi:hypothetical protein